MKQAEIHEMTNEEMERAIIEKQRELFNLRLQNHMGQVDNPSLIRQTRREVARLLTEQTNRRSAQEG